MSAAAITGTAAAPGADIAALASSASSPATDASGLPWQIYICRACGLLYDEGKGDIDSGLAAGTRFADIPDDWSCPLCGVAKSDFEPYVIEAARVARRPARSTRPAAARHDAGTVIVGAGRAGWQIAQSLRGRDAAMPIALVTACNGDVYDKPLLSVALARGVALERMAHESGAAAAQRLNIRLLPHTQAVRIVPASRLLRTSRGTLRYRHLVLAHGAQARSLPQFPAQLCWRINHLQAYAKFRAGLGDGVQRIAIVGAGLIGSELANDLALAGHEVTLLDIAARPLAASLDEAQSLQLLEAWSELSIRFIGGVQVGQVTQARGAGQIDARHGVKRITTECGLALEADHVIVAAGLQTPSRLAGSAGLAWNNGIVVAPHTLATSATGIHALGDCISIGGQVSRYIEPIGRQARTIAAGILGDAPVPYLQMRVPLRIKTTSLPFTL